MGRAVKEMKGKTRAAKSPRYSAPSRNVLNKASGREVIWQNVADVFKVSAERITNQSFVYVVGEENEGAVKIGVAVDPIRRLRSMQTGNPRRLRVEHVLMGTRLTEKLLHEIWEPSAIISPRQQGKVDAAPMTEWFEADIRTRLFPVLDTIAEQQIKLVHEPIEYVQDDDGEWVVNNEITLEQLDDIVLRAHTEHGVEIRGREPVRLLAQGAGYVNAARSSRIPIS